jgi:hypothetical protein
MWKDWKITQKILAKELLFMPTFEPGTGTNFVENTVLQKLPLIRQSNAVQRVLFSGISKSTV